MTRYLDRLLTVLRRAMFRAAFGESYGYVIRTLAKDPRIKTARMVDIVVRKDAVERRFEADWIKMLARTCWPDIERERARREREFAAYVATNPTDGQAPGREGMS